MWVNKKREKGMCVFTPKEGSAEITNGETRGLKLAWDYKQGVFLCEEMDGYGNWQHLHGVQKLIIEFDANTNLPIVVIEKYIL